MEYPCQSLSGVGKFSSIQSISNMNRSSTVRAQKCQFRLLTCLNLKNNNISINVFGLVYPLSITKSRHEKHVNLLLKSDKDKRHYCLIKNMSRLLEDRTKHDGETFYCYTTKGLLDTHIIDCKPHGAQKVTFPQKEENQWINFTSISKHLKVPFVIYADLECFTRPIDREKGKT